MKKTSRRTASELCRESIILGYLIVFAEFLQKKASRSLFVSVCSCYDRLCKVFMSGLPGAIHGFIHKSDARVLSIKMCFAAWFNKSIFINAFRRLFDLILHSQVSSIGNGIFSTGFSMSLVYIINKYLFNADIKLSGLAVGIALMVFSVPVILSKSILCDALKSSRFSKVFLFGLLGFSPSELDRHGSTRSSIVALYMISGIMLGASTHYFPIEYILIAVMLVICVAVILCKPETGCLLSALTLPFLPTMVMAGLLLLVLCSFMLKVLRGKRTVRCDLSDICVYFFMFLMFMGGIFSVNPSASIKPAMLYTVFMLSYFIIVNIIRTTKLIYQYISLLMISLFAASAYGVYQNFFGTSNALWHDSSMFSDIETRVVSTFENPNVFGEYLILLIPLAISLFLMKKGFARKTVALVVVASAGAGLIYTWSRGAWLGFLIAFFVYLLIAYKYTFILLIAGAAVVPFSPLFIPQSIINRLTSIGNLKDTSTNYRVNIWRAVVKMIGSHPFSGIGIGEGAFDKVYPYYALSGIEGAPHSHSLYLQITVELGVVGLVVFLIAMFVLLSKGFSAMKLAASSDDNRLKVMSLVIAGAVCGIIAFLIMGATDYVWYNYRVFLMFWSICGVASASSNILSAERPSPCY